MINLSVIIIAKNEEHNINQCLQSVSFADEFIVIDDYSLDSTKEIAENFGAQVYQRYMQGNYAEQQNYGITKANGKWLLFIDCDERVTKKLQDEIQKSIQKNDLYSFMIKRINHFNHQIVRFGVMKPDYTVRLVPNKQTIVKGMVHQQIISPYPVKKMENVMLHYTYNSWEHYYSKLENYAKLSARKYREQNKKIKFLPYYVIIKPIWAFIKAYVFNLGFLDGKIGFILAVNHSFYTFSKYVRLLD